MKMSSAGNKQFRAMVVSGEKPRRDELVDVLKNCGYAVIGAIDFAAVSKLASQEYFDAILCQDQLQDGTGLDVLNWLRAENIQSHFILMTDEPDVPGIELVLAQEGTDVFDTPGNYAKLFPKLAELQATAQAAAEEDAMAVHPVKLPELTPGPERNERANVDLVMDIPISVSVILGSTTMLVQELLQLGPGSVVELNKRAGEPIDIYVNDKLLAIGEVVVVNETFGVRISEIIDPKQRVQVLT